MNSLIQENIIQFSSFETGKESLSGAISNTFSIEIEDAIPIPLDDIEISFTDIQPMVGLFRLIDGQLTRVIEDYPPAVSGGMLKLVGLADHGGNT